MKYFINYILKYNAEIFLIFSSIEDFCRDAAKIMPDTLADRDEGLGGKFWNLTPF